MTAVLLLPVLALARTPAPERWTVPAWGETEVTLGPAGELYPRYVADPRRARLGLSVLGIEDGEVEGAGDSRYGLSIGERLTLARFHPAGEPERGVQLDLEVGFFGQFDRDNSTDNVGWDGVYTLQLSGRLAPARAWRFGVAHDSSHVGDELIESDGRERIDYTREEVFLGVAQGFGEGWLGYLEYGHAYTIRNEDLMERGRAQAGLQLEPAPRWWSGHLGYYAALDLSAFEENDWDANVTLQVGWALALGEGGRTLRLGLQWYDGRTPMGEFFDEEETHLALGLWFDW